MKDKENNVIVRESFSMAFKGGEIYFSQLDALYDQKVLVMEKFRKDMNSIRRPSATGLIGINLNQTQVDTEMAKEITDLIIDLQKVRKAVFIGLDRKIKHFIKEQLKSSDVKISFVYTFIDDYEKAKLWLVGKN